MRRAGGIAALDFDEIDGFDDDGRQRSIRPAHECGKHWQKCDGNPQE